MTKHREVGCFFLGCAVGVAAALILPANSRKHAMQYLRQKTNRGFDYAKDRVEDARHVVDSAATRAGKVMNQVSQGLEAAKKVVSSVERLRDA